MNSTIGAILGLYWGYMGIMEKKMEIAIMGYIELWVSGSKQMLFSYY